MSMRIIAASSPKRASARVRASSVFPTPVGPRNRKLPMGRFGSESPARARLTASATASTASSWPITRSWSCSSRCMSRSRSSLVSWLTGGDLCRRLPPRGLEGSQPVLPLLNPTLELLGLLEVFGGDRLVFLPAKPLDLFLEDPGVLRLGLGSQAHPRRRLVHEVYCLVR